METRQERYRRRTLFKAGWFETVDARRVEALRKEISALRERGPVAPEQEALFPFFLSHPLADSLFEIERDGASWLGMGSPQAAALALVAFRSVSSAPACFQYLTNSGSGAVSEDDAIFKETRDTIAAIKDLGMWIAE